MAVCKLTQCFEIKKVMCFGILGPNGAASPQHWDCIKCGEQNWENTVGSMVSCKLTKLAKSGSHYRKTQLLSHMTAAQNLK
jgi:hypothetical protein